MTEIKGYWARKEPPSLTRRSWFVMAALALLGMCLRMPASSPTRAVIDETGRKVEVPVSPQRIVSIAPSVTEILYDLGLESRVVGRTDYCDYPPEVKKKPSVGGLISPSVERIVSLRPDLVVGTPEVNKIEIANELSLFHIPLYGLHARNLNDVLHSLEDLGALTGTEARANSLVQSLRDRRDAVLKKVAGLKRPRVLYLIWYQPISVPGHGAFLTDLIDMAGGESISADLHQDWGQMSLEEIVRRDPEIILIPRSNESSPPIEDLKKWPGWSSTTAAKTNRILLVNDSANHPSPRLFDALESFARIFHPQVKW